MENKTRTLRMLSNTLRHCHNLYNKVGNEEQTWISEINQGAKEAIELIKQQEKMDETIDRLYKILDVVCKDVREETEEDYVCGLCEYDGAHKTDSGEWAGECPGFESSDCFCMKNEIRKMCGKELI